jgi:hypothetical protein
MEWLKALVGTKQSVLVEKDGHGHAENFAPVALPLDGGGLGRGESIRPLGGSRSQPLPIKGRESEGTIVNVRITSVENDTLIGEPL